jgi:hypothetical protein
MTQEDKPQDYAERVLAEFEKFDFPVSEVWATKEQLKTFIRTALENQKKDIIEEIKNKIDEFSTPLLQRSSPITATLGLILSELKKHCEKLK